MDLSEEGERAEGTPRGRSVPPNEDGHEQNT